MIKIDYLANHKRYLTSVVKWVYNEWWQYKRETFGDVIDLYHTLLHTSEIPIALIALYDKKPAGTVLICDRDPDIQLDDGPWLEGLFVHSRYRKRGIGKRLVRRICEIAKDSGHEKVLLSTHIAGYYEKMGWEVVKGLANGDKVMRKVLSGESI
ncbi:MAG: GNAT family N-acetyltransferase [Fibrobacterota bacterium]